MKRLFSKLFVPVAVIGATLTLSACVYYPTGPAYAYDSGPYYAGPPVYGTVIVGGGGGWGHDGWGHDGWGHDGWGHDGGHRGWR